MSGIIRATEKHRTAQYPAFNFEDMAARANQYLDGVRGEARKIVAQAQREAAGIKQRAKAEGYEAGQQQVVEIVRSQLASVLPALRQAVQDVEQARQAWLAHWEGAAIHVATAIAGRIVRREITETPAFATEKLREALELAAGASHLRIRLNPADHAAMDGQADVLAKDLAPLATCEITPDVNITPGGCRVETSFGFIDQQIEAQLARIEEELT